MDATKFNDELVQVQQLLGALTIINIAIDEVRDELESILGFDQIEGSVQVIGMLMLSAVASLHAISPEIANDLVSSIEDDNYRKQLENFLAEISNIPQ
jgi:hypothetical protein